MRRLVVCWFALMLAVGMSVAQSEKGKAKGHEGHAAAAGNADAGVKDAIKKMEEEMRQGTLKADTSAAEKYLADDYHTVAGANGQAYDKKQVMDRLKSGATKYTQINISNDEIAVYDHDLAISHGIADVKLTIDGKDGSAKYHYARTWLKRNGKWQAIWLQSTKVQ